MNHQQYDVIIAGSGFSGSIAALALNKSGFKVCLIEKGSHPRFAIGESSTPIADMILRDLSARYDLPFLEKLSRYGSWQKHYPQLLCGIKRGFSYFHHTPGQLFRTDKDHSNELLIAASSNDQDSDTNWYRPDIDAFLVGKVKEAGITYLDNTEIKSKIEENDSSLRIKVQSGHTNRFMGCKWIIDATGSPRLASEIFGVKSSSDNFETDSWALYSHFRGIKRWNRHIQDDLGLLVHDYPYDADHSALHHLVAEGWMWNLRFKNELVSAGFVFDRPGQDHINPTGDKVKLWSHLLSKYPSILNCFKNYRLASEPGQLIQTGRLQRRMNRVYGNRWLALNHTAGFVDPLHSTGIAHTLTGLERILKIFTTSDINGERMSAKLKQHQSAFFKELYLIDLLVAGCYQARISFDLFHAYTMVYFAATLSYEQNRLSGNFPSHYLMAGDPSIQAIVKESYRDLKEVIRAGVSEKRINSYIEKTRKRIAPYNIAGLLDKDKRNMYHHTAVSLNDS